MTERKMNLVAKEIEKRGYSVKRASVFKNNTTKESIAVKLNENIAANLYFDDYDENLTSKEIASKMIEVIENAPAPSRFSNVSDYIKIENVFGTLVNTEMNRDLLATVPHREICDLSVVYRINFGSDENGISSAVVNEKLMEQMKVNEDDLYKAAIENMGAPLVIDMFSLLMGMAPEKLEEFEPDMLQAIPMYVITNESKMYASFGIVKTEILSELANKMEDDLWIIPSSIHECIVIPKSRASYGELEDMICLVNNEEVKTEEVLSNHPYSFDRETKELTEM